EPGCEREQRVAVERARVGHERVVHLPELALRVRGFGCLGRELGTRVQARIRQMTKDVCPGYAEPLPNPVQAGVRSATVGTVVVAVLDDFDAGVRLAQNVVAVRVDGRTKSASHSWVFQPFRTRRLRGLS